MDDRPEGQGVGQAREQESGAGAQSERGEGARQQSPSGQPPQGGARRGDRDPRERDSRDTRDPRRRRQPPQQQQQGGREGQQQQSRRPEASINMGELRELFGMFTAQGLTEFELEKEGFRVRLRRDLTPAGSPAAADAAGSPPLSAVQPSAQVLPFVAPQVTPVPQQEGAASSSPSAPAADASAAADEAAEQLHIITSPIVGTFYRAPSPAADPFVRQGSRVESDTVVCIIEAMKLMNEILAETSGMVEEVYVENGQPVEYGQALFGIRK